MWGKEEPEQQVLGNRGLGWAPGLPEAGGVQAWLPEHGPCGLLRWLPPDLCRHPAALPHSSSVHGDDHGAVTAGGHQVRKQLLPWLGGMGYSFVLVNEVPGLGLP